jgi:hypothetical protein
VDAIGIPLEKRRGVSEPDFRPVTAEITVPASIAQGRGVDDHGAPCCTTPEADDPDEPPFFVGAKVRNRQEHAAVTAAEVPVPVNAPRAAAIAMPLDERPAVREPARVPITLLLALAILLTIGLFRHWRCRRELRENQSAPPTRPLPDELAWLASAPAPQPEPEVQRAKERVAKRELELA